MTRGEKENSQNWIWLPSNNAHTNLSSKLQFTRPDELDSNSNFSTKNPNEILDGLRQQPEKLNGRKRFKIKIAFVAEIRTVPKSAIRRYSTFAFAIGNRQHLVAKTKHFQSQRVPTVEMLTMTR